VTGFALQILGGTAHTHAYVGVMIVVLSIADMWIRITRECPPMSEDPFRCPQCGGEFDLSDAYDYGRYVEIVLTCYECPRNWTVGSYAWTFRRL
jgi:hypothetical protein